MTRLPRTVSELIPTLFGHLPDRKESPGVLVLLLYVCTVAVSSSVGATVVYTVAVS